MNCNGARQAAWRYSDQGNGVVGEHTGQAESDYPILGGDLNTDCGLVRASDGMVLPCKRHVNEQIAPKLEHENGSIFRECCLRNGLFTA